MILALTPLTILAMWGVERVWPGRAFPRVPWWSVIGLVGFALIAGIGVATPYLLPLAWVRAHRVIDASRLGTAGGVAASYLALSFLGYAWHRATHALPALWRFLHRWHHVPARVDIAGAAFFHPLDTFAYAAIQGVALTALGLPPATAALTAYVAMVLSMIPHWNIRTPRWLGYFVQRPESHCVHHAKDVHAFNYSDLPLWDVLFGTFRNPESFDGEVGIPSGVSPLPALSRRERVG